MGSDNFFWYLTNQRNKTNEDYGIYMVLMANYLGKNITVIWSGRIWNSDENIDHQVVLLYKGRQSFFLTDVGTEALGFLIILRKVTQLRDNILSP